MVSMVKAFGLDITKEEAEAYLAELDDIELDSDDLQKVAGGGCYEYTDDPYKPCGNF